MSEAHKPDFVDLDDVAMDPICYKVTLHAVADAGGEQVHPEEVREYVVDGDLPFELGQRFLNAWDRWLNSQLALGNAKGVPAQKRAKGEVDKAYEQLLDRTAEVLGMKQPCSNEDVRRFGDSALTKLNGHMASRLIEGRYQANLVQIWGPLLTEAAAAGDGEVGAPKDASPANRAQKRAAAKTRTKSRSH